MRTRSSSNLVGESSPNPTTSNPKRRNRRRSKQPFSLEESPVDTMADQRTMAELLRAPTEGYAEVIVVPLNLAEHFELTHSLINMMTSDQFFGLEKDNPHDHIRWFNKITSTIKYKDVPNSAIKLMLFSFSLAGVAHRWLEKEPPRSILTWEDLVSKFINEFFPPSRTRNLRNEISNFEQHFGESFHEAWDRYKDLLRACPHHDFTELHQLNTFYNALNPADQDSLNSAAGVKSNDVNSSSSSEIATLTHVVNQQTSAVTTAMTAILKQFQATPPPASVKAVEEICVTCEDVEPELNLLLQEIIILDPDDQPMWENAKIVAPTPNSAIIQPNVDENFVINSTHLNMIRENKFDGYLRADPHDHIREFLAICNMFRYGKTQSEAVKLMIFPFSLCDEAKTWFNELNEESITSKFSQNECESLTDALLRLKNMLQKCHGHGLTKGTIIQIFYHGLDERTQAILDVTVGGIFLYKTPNQAFQFLEDKVLFEHDWSIKSQNDHHQNYVSFTDRSDSNTDNSQLMEKLESLIIKIDSQIINLNDELEDMCKKYNELRNGNASKNNMNNATPMCERHEANYIQSEGYHNRNSYDSFSHQSLHDRNDSEKSLTKLNNDVRNDLEDFKRRIRSMRTVHWKLYDSDDGKTTGVLPNKKSKPINQEPQSKTDFE
ncbi:reverse transcriptase domain-containing protein [Tanacetum coccineum]|uniref:Reverse transcriptase domain-containing protein n=1 Tax=Tanacetum coccineum TaxID=301880 RepID=A0ABQ5G9A6_9ASTR